MQKKVKIPKQSKLNAIYLIHHSITVNGSGRHLAEKKQSPDRTFMFSGVRMILGQKSPERRSHLCERLF